MCGLAMVDDFATATSAGTVEAEVVSVQNDPPVTTPTVPPTTPALPDKPSQTQTTPNNPAATTQPAAPQPITDYQKSQFARYRNDFLKARNVDLGNDAAVRSAWADFLASWGVRSAIDMTSVQAEEALTIIYDKCHPPEAKAMFGDHGPDGGTTPPAGNG
jgi:cytoskeletal protein RodZ